MEKKVIELKVLDDDDLSGVYAVALVEEPAIQVDFYAFNDDIEMIDGIVDILVKIKDPQNRKEVLDYVLKDLENQGIDTEGLIERVMGEKFETYNDYPEGAKNNACRAVEWAEKNGWGDCGTDVGKQRAHQLCKGENISEETISRMASFARHEQNKDVPYTEGCGGLMWDAWGGSAGINWAQSKLEKIRAERELFVEPRLGEGKDDFVGRCISVLVGDEGYDEEQAAAICYTSWEEKMGVDVSGLAPYIQNKPRKKVKYVEASKEVEDLILAFANEVGYTEERLKEIFANAFLYTGGSRFPDELIPGLDEGKEGQITLYKYEGGLSSNSRTFCRQMKAIDKYYTFSDIEAMSQIAVNAGFGPRGTNTYDVWLFKGGANCKHYWSRYFTQYKDGLFRLQKRGRVSGRPGREPYEMPNRGYLMSQMFMDDEQQILIGPAMIPDMKIPRKDKDTGEVYYVRFTKDTISTIQEKFMKTQSTHSTNQDHDPDKPADTYIFESWIIEDPLLDKSKKYGFDDLPEGTWMVKMRVNNKKVWERIKKGELKGFSVEGDFIPSRDK